MKERGYITTRYHIEKIMSEKTGMSLEQIKDNIDYILERVYDMSKGEDIYKIYLSEQLGELLCTRKTLLSKIRTSRKNKEFFIKKREFLVENEDKIFTSKHKKRTKQNIKKKFFKGEHTYKELEEIQNKVYEEHKKRFE